MLKSSYSGSGKKIPVIFRYPDSKGLFVYDPKFKAGGAPIQISLLAKELAKDSRYEVHLWVDGETPSEPIEGVRLISLTPPISKGMPLVSRIINKNRLEEFAKKFVNGVFIFTVVDQKFFPEHQDIIHSYGGKTIYRIASSLDVCPELRGITENDAFAEALLKADRIIAQTEQQQNDLKNNYDRDAKIVPPAFFDDSAIVEKKDSILWVGHSWTVKRPWIVLELARNFPDEHFIMVMPTVEEGVAFAIKDGAKKISNLEIIDFVDPGKIQKLYNSAKIVLNTSIYEGFPNTLHQASIGRAPYVSLSWNPDNYLETRGIGLGSENDVTRMILNLRKYLSNDFLREQDGARSYENFKKNNDVAKVIEILKSEINSALC